MKKIVVFGAGYVGLVTGTGLSDLGHKVLVYDIDESKIRQLKEGRIPIFEPGLADIVVRNQRNRRLFFGTTITDDFSDADAYFIAVGTPPSADGSADLSAVMAVTDTIASVAKDHALVVVKSTVPVGTCDKVQARLADTSTASWLEVVSNPEFLKEGDAVNDFFRPDRIVVGARSPQAHAFMRELYAPLQLAGERLIATDPRSSELVKYASNAMLASRISFMNELSRLCHATGADIHSVRLGMGTDSRIGKRFLYAGPGYGGSCFPKDVQALAALARDYGIELEVTEATHRANERQADFMAKLIASRLPGGVAGKHFALWGCAFKPDTDDIRESPAVKLTQTLLNKGAGLIVAHDPEAAANYGQLFAERGHGDRVVVAVNEYDALNAADALILLTEWRCYRAPDFDEMARRMAKRDGAPPLVFDARNIWRHDDVTSVGLGYQGIGTHA